MINLALLDPENFKDGLDYVKSLINKNFKNSSKWKTFLNYFIKEWQLRVKPNAFCVNDVIDRTNNFVESYHSTLNLRLNKSPQVEKLMSK